MNSLEKAKKIASILDEKKGRKVKILKIAEQTVIADFFVIATGTSSTQVKALSDEVEYRLKVEDGIEHRGREGFSTANWILLDYNDVIVHVFDKTSREFFNLERLWAEAEEIPFDAVKD